MNSSHPDPSGFLYGTEEDYACAKGYNKECSRLYEYVTLPTMTQAES